MEIEKGITCVTHVSRTHHLHISSQTYLKHSILRKLEQKLCAGEREGMCVRAVRTERPVWPGSRFHLDAH